MSDGTHEVRPGTKRPGRIWIVLALTLAVVGLMVGLTGLSTQEPGGDFENVIGAGDSQRIFGGVRQLEDRLGSEDAPVEIQYFVDVQSSTYKDQFLETIPPTVNTDVRSGVVQFLLRNRSLTQNATELSFYGVEAAVKQGYGWQFAYLMVRNQEEARKHRLNEDFLETLAGAIPHLDLPQWKEDFDEGVKPDSDMTADLQAQDELAINAKIRDEPAFIVAGPNGTRILQDAPGLDRLQLAIDEVR
ncbi:MAG: thioredoxin domain-containing protein [Solirubrobacterales bacterium]|nr:thioredoxin domain-containing protein [Solirubrobacterales bacterium]